MNALVRTTNGKGPKACIVAPCALVGALALAFACLFATAPCAFAADGPAADAHVAEEPAMGALAAEEPVAKAPAADPPALDAAASCKPALPAKDDAAAASPEPDAPAADGAALPAGADVVVIVTGPASCEPGAPAEGDSLASAEGGAAAPSSSEVGLHGADAPTPPAAPGSTEVEIRIELPCSEEKAANEPPCDDTGLPVVPDAPDGPDVSDVHDGPDALDAPDAPDGPDVCEGGFAHGCDGKAEAGLGEGASGGSSGNSTCKGPGAEGHGDPSWPNEHKADVPGLSVPSGHGANAASPEVSEHGDGEGGAIEQPSRAPASLPVSLLGDFRERVDGHAPAEAPLLQRAPTASRKAGGHAVPRRSYARPSPSARGAKLASGKALADDAAQPAAHAEASTAPAAYGPVAAPDAGADTGPADLVGRPSERPLPGQSARERPAGAGAAAGGLPSERAQRAERLIVGISKVAKTQTATAISACAAAFSDSPATESAVATTLPDRPMAPLVAGVGIALACLLALAFCLKI